MRQKLRTPRGIDAPRRSDTGQSVEREPERSAIQSVSFDGKNPPKGVSSAGPDHAMPRLVSCGTELGREGAIDAGYFEVACED